MVDRGVDVGIEAVFARSGQFPRGLRLLLGKADFHDRLSALEPVFPWHHHPHGRAVLVRQRFAVKAEREQRQRMHGFVHAQAFHIRPLQHAHALSRHLCRVEQRDEFDELRIACRFDALDQFRQRKTDPGNHHRPAFHATHAVDALFQRREFQEFVDVVNLLLLDLAFHLDLPRTGFQLAGMHGRVVLVGAELVVIVVFGNGFQWRQRIAHGVSALRHPCGNLAPACALPDSTMPAL